MTLDRLWLMVSLEYPRLECMMSIFLGEKSPAPTGDSIDKKKPNGSAKKDGRGSPHSTTSSAEAGTPGPANARKEVLFHYARH